MPMSRSKTDTGKEGSNKAPGSTSDANWASTSECTTDKLSGNISCHHTMLELVKNEICQKIDTSH